jgi:superfamily II DNA or RNA helicase
MIPKATGFVCHLTEESKIHELWPQLINDEGRNRIILDDIVSVINEGRFPVVLTERREHLALLESMLKDKLDYLAVLHGGIQVKRRKAIIEELRNIPDNQRKALLATGSYIGEGFDEPRLDTLFVTMPVSFKGRIIQYVGRLHREHAGKNEIRVYDYVDASVSILSAMYKKRLKVYRSLGYSIRETGG